MKKLALSALCFGLCYIGSAQDSNKTLVNELLKHWQSSKDLSLAVAQAMPDDAYSFKASPEEMSFGAQMNHIALANANYCAGAIGTANPLAKMPKPGSSPTEDAKPAAMKNLTTSYDYCIDGLREMTDADLQKTVSTRMGSISKFELFWGGFTHAAHHRGQAEVYLRLKGITPPQYTF